MLSNSVWVLAFVWGVREGWGMQVRFPPFCEDMLHKESHATTAKKV